MANLRNCGTMGARYHCDSSARTNNKTITMAATNYWLVSPHNALTGELCILPFGAKELNNYQKMCNYLKREQPESRWTICTSECATIFHDEQLRFQNGRFERL